MARNDDLYSRVWLALLYEEDPVQKSAIDKLKSGAYDVAYIIHNRDLKEDGTPKKEHYHFVIRFQNQKSLTALSNQLAVPSNYLEAAKSIKASLLYLIHKGNEDKAQYSITEVNGSLKKLLEQYLDDSTEDDRALKILSILDGYDRTLTLKEFIEICAKEGLFADLRRSSYLFLSLLKEHNDRIFMR